LYDRAQERVGSAKADPAAFQTDSLGLALCGAEMTSLCVDAVVLWTDHLHISLEIDLSVCGLFAERELIGWARGFHRSGNGVREKLAQALGIGRAAVRNVVERLLVPVFLAYNRECGSLAHHSTLDDDRNAANAWLRAGASCKLISDPAANDAGFGSEWQVESPQVAALFVLHFVVEQVRGKVSELLFESLAREINRQKPETLTGQMWSGYTPHDVIREVLRAPDSGAFATELMRRAVVR
jgi:hypothetical protein